MSEKDEGRLFVGSGGFEVFQPDLSEDMARARLVAQAATEIAAPLAETIMAARSADGSYSVEEATGALIERLLAAGWKLALFAVPEREDAKAFYASLLRNFADGIDPAG